MRHVVRRVSQSRVQRSGGGIVDVMLLGAVSRVGGDKRGGGTRIGVCGLVWVLRQAWVGRGIMTEVVGWRRRRVGAGGGSRLDVGWARLLLEDGVVT